MTDFRALCAELLAIFEKYDDESNFAGVYWDMEKDGNDILDRAQAALALSEPAPPAERGLAELAYELRHFLTGYQQMRGLDSEHIYSIHRGDAKEAHLTVSCLTRIADMLERQQPEPEKPTVMEIIALANEIEEAGLGQVDLVRAALARWGTPNLAETRSSLGDAPKTTPSKNG